MTLGDHSMTTTATGQQPGGVRMLAPTTTKTTKTVV